jgi:dipeptidyl aminopeptidase/acylaminoacyl peptidase
VRLDLDVDGDGDGEGEPAVVALPGPPGTDTAVEGRLEEITAAAADGTPLRAWLALPPRMQGGAAPTPLLVWMHGGPLSSWNAWHWRWNPWVLTARGYAVLMPDPALSTGYGQGMIRRGWGQWGGTPYDDVIALTDAALDRADLGLDRGRTAAMGGSYGGYLANWVAGHTDRFKAIVTHASLWALDQFEGTTDSPAAWRRQWGDLSRAGRGGRQWSPHQYGEAIRTPMLVIHGDKDYRVPIGEALRLWDDLVRRGVDAKFLYFPNEGHWVLNPGNVRVWYETVLAFLDHHVCGRPWERPPLV